MSFIELLVGALIALQAVLVAVFGMLTSIFTTYSAILNSKSLDERDNEVGGNEVPTIEAATKFQLPPIANEARTQCRWINRVVIFNTLAIVILLFLSVPLTASGILSIIAIFLSVILLATVTFRLSRRM